MSWHVESETLAAYARGTVDEASAFSVEAHLVACAACRDRVGALVDERRLVRVWEGVADELDAPSAGPVEWLLLRAGVRDDVARLLAATPSLTVSWLAAVVAALAFGLAAAHGSERGLVVFLALAPLLPLAGVAAAYGPGLDPTYEIGLATPARSFRLLLLRAAAVLTTTTALAGIASLALPVFDWRVAAWLLPALGLTTISLALATYVPAHWASGGLAFAWIATVLLASVLADDRFVAFRAPAQLAFAALALAAAAVVASRRDAFETRREL